MGEIGGSVLSSISVGGRLLTRALLSRISRLDPELPGLAPSEYGMAENVRLRSEIEVAWQRLRTAWDGLNAARAQLADTDRATDQTRQFLLAVLDELGYSDVRRSAPMVIEGREFPISHTWSANWAQTNGDDAPGQTDIALHLLGAGLSLDRRTPGAAGAARLAPHSLVQQFLNASDAHLWAHLSNGLTWRLLRDNMTMSRPNYVEFDLRAMFDGQQYADFVVFWLLCHRTRIEAAPPELCWLEAWATQAEEDGARALNRLGRGVEQALAVLGNGFLGHPANHALRQRLSLGTDQSTSGTAHRYWQQLLRLVYQLLFILVAEERGVLLMPETETTTAARTTFSRHYSLRRLRKLARSQVGSDHGDLWQQVQVVLTGLGSHDGLPALGLPPLGGQLFSTDATMDLRGGADFAAAQLANKDLLQAVRSLCFVVEGDGSFSTVDYRNMGAEELGSIYESLLELHPHLDVPGRSFSISGGAGNERKATGAFYTPVALTSHLCDMVLNPVLSDAMAQDDPEAALLSISVCDPACGSGHFLVAAARRIGSRLAEVRADSAVETSDLTPQTVLEATRDAVRHCIYGVDINPMSVELARMALWMESLTPGLPLAFLDHRVKVGNSLLGATEDLVAEGIPDSAFAATAGDTASIARSWKKSNSHERGGQGSLLIAQETEDVEIAPWLAIDNMPESTIDQVAAKAAAVEQANCTVQEAALRADLWCGAFLIAKDGSAPRITSSQLDDPPNEGPVRAAIEQIRRDYSPFHWHVEFPEVFSMPDQPPGFDVILGNPPFLNQLSTTTAPPKKLAAFFKARFPGVAKGYADSATLFLELSSQLIKADGGRVGLVQPDSVLSTSDSAGARASVLDRGDLRSLWVAGEKVFEANVMTCAPTILNGKHVSKTRIRRFRGARFEELPPLEIDDVAISADSWAPLISEGFGIPRVDLAIEGQLREVLSATADFRDQYYGLVPFVGEADGRTPDGERWAALVTSGLIDPARSLWSVRSTKFNKVTFDAPLVDLGALKDDGELTNWAESRLVPKALVATQTKVLEVLVDEHGTSLPSVPVITVVPLKVTLWHVAAALMSPPVTAWAAAHYMGAALSSDAIKLSASQIEGLPLPVDRDAWDEAAERVRRAHNAETEQGWRHALEEASRLMCNGYAVENEAELMTWWDDRVPSWKG